MQTPKQRTWIENVLTCKKRTEQPKYMLNNIALLDKDFAQIKMNLCVHTSSKETISLKQRISALSGVCTVNQTKIHCPGLLLQQGVEFCLRVSFAKTELRDSY